MNWEGCSQSRSERVQAGAALKSSHSFRSPQVFREKASLSINPLMRHNPHVQGHTRKELVRGATIG